MKTRNKVVAVAFGKRADIGSYKIDRMLPNRFVDAVGPIVFLDHILPLTHNKIPPLQKVEGTGPHPHRGIATITYVLKGIAEHRDSAGHHAIVKSGGVQWMKAGKGIVHDEVLKVDHDQDDVTHAFQFWIDLPSKNKGEPADYLPIQAEEIPKKELRNGIGWIKIIAGGYDGEQSHIPSYSKQFIYHLHLQGATSFSLTTSEEMEYAAFLPLHDIAINDIDYNSGELLSFEKGDGEIEITNLSMIAADIILFGGEPYTEPIVSAGPFVMNSQHEISVAYNDFYDGKYGEISYDE